MHERHAVVVLDDEQRAGRARRAGSRRRAAAAGRRRRRRHADHQRGRDDGAHADHSVSVPGGATGSPEGRAITTERAPVARYWRPTRWTSSAVTRAYSPPRANRRAEVPGRDLELAQRLGAPVARRELAARTRSRAAPPPCASSAAATGRRRQLGGRLDDQPLGLARRRVPCVIWTQIA